MASPRTRRLLLLLAALALWLLALWPRLRDLDATMALADTVGPFLTAASPGRGPHAPPYGWGLYPPYAMALAAPSLSAALGFIAALHALVAPLAFAAVLRLRPGAIGAALAAGALAAVDRGLLDTTLSGAEGYLAATWLAAAVLGLAAADRPWGPWLAAIAWAFALLCHPFAVATVPLLLLLPRRRASLGALLLAGIMLLPRLLQAAGAPLPEAEGDPLVAPTAWLHQGGAGAAAVLAGGLLGLAHRRTRALALATLASAGLMIGLGLWLGYLRDHHLRLLTVPALVGLAALPRAWGLLALALFRPPPSQLPPPGHPNRPGTLGLTTELAAALHGQRQPVLVEGAWISGAPAAEPAAVMLDLHLRGHALGPQRRALIVSAERGQMPALPGEVLHQGDRHALLALTVEEQAAWAPTLCERGARLVDAREGALALAPSLQVGGWGSTLGPHGPDDPCTSSSP